MNNAVLEKLLSLYYFPGIFYFIMCYKYENTSHIMHSKYFQSIFFFIWQISF